jgi:hypothetical protein
LHNIKKSA